MWARWQFRILHAVVAFGLLVPTHVYAQAAFNVRIEYVDNDQFPYMEAYLSISDANGLPLKEELADAAFSLMEDGNPVSSVEIERFTNKNQSLAIALVIDTSASMDSKESPTPLNRAVESARYFVQQLAGQDQVSVINFSEAPEVVLGLTSAQDNRVMLALDSLEPGKNKTALYDAIVEAVNVLKGFTGRRIIVVVTDGKDTGTGLFDFESAMREATLNSIPVYPMGFGNVINVAEMKRMAELTGGVAQVQPSALDLQYSFATILDILREQYRIKYLSNLPADDRDHELAVTVDYLGGRGQATYHFLSRSSTIPVSLPAMQAGQVIGGLVNFAPVIDWQAPINDMEILVDGVQIAHIGAAPFEFEWNSFDSDILPGPHDFLIKVTDMAGNAGQVNLPLDVEPPIDVEIVAPSKGESVTGHVEIVANVIPLPHISVSRVAFLVDNVEIGSLPGAPDQTEYRVAWDSTKYPAENHPVSVVAYDVDGLFVTEEKITVGVQVGGNSWMVVLVVLAIAGLIIPIAIRSRKRAAKTTVGGGIVAMGQPTLRELEGMNPNQVWPISQAEVRLGRKRDENDIALKGLNASRRHASIKFENGQYVIYSLSPNNPVVVNNSTVVQKQVLRPGDMIRLGETLLRFDI